MMTTSVNAERVVTLAAERKGAAFKSAPGGFTRRWICCRRE